MSTKATTTKARNPANRTPLEGCTTPLRFQTPAQRITAIGWTVNPVTDCMLWKGLTNDDGYGVLSINGTTKLVHRLVYELATGKTLPAGVVVRHSCDTTACSNRDHLLEGTQQQNVDDMLARGRGYWDTTTVCHKGHTLAPNGARYEDGSRCGTCRTGRKVRRIQQDVRRQRINGSRFEALGAAWDLPDAA